jgi:serine/threonine protein kinase
MTSERWHRIEELYHAARTQPSSARAAFLHAACDGDSTLVREVESLFAQDDATTTHGAPGQPALGIAARWVTEQRGPLEGQRIGVYEIGPLLGAGGMGEVYRARDTRLRRDVAIKVLPSVFTSDPERLARFEREARVLAALNHPYIEARRSRFARSCSSSSTARRSLNGWRAEVSRSAKRWRSPDKSPTRSTPPIRRASSTAI